MIEKVNPQLQLVEKMIELVGADHIVFGTDCPLQGPLQIRFAREIIRNLDITDTDKDKIFCKNAEKLIGQK